MKIKEKIEKMAPDAIQDEMLEPMNRNVANLQLEYIKLHNFHWNVKGMHFLELHRLTEEYYNYFAEQFDAVAERMLQLGGQPFSSMREYLDNAGLNEADNRINDAAEGIRMIREDFEVILREFHAISGMAAAIDDAGTANLADDNIEWFEKALWMLRSMN